MIKKLDQENEMITYKDDLNNSKVYLNTKLTGTIKKIKTRTIEGWIYFPKGHKHGGEVFTSRQFCKNSLEEE